MDRLSILSSLPRDSFLYCLRSEYCATILLIRMGRMVSHSCSSRPSLCRAEWPTSIRLSRDLRFLASASAAAASAAAAAAAAVAVAVVVTVAVAAAAAVVAVAAAAAVLEGGGLYCSASFAMISLTLGSLTAAIRSGAVSSFRALPSSNL